MTLTVAALALSAAPATSAPGLDPAALASAVDKLIAAENAERAKTREAPVVDDLTFLRRVSVDLTGRIPTDSEIQKYLSWSAADRRSRAIDEYMGREQFADRWAIFFGDLL